MASRWFLRCPVDEEHFLNQRFCDGGGDGADDSRPRSDDRHRGTFRATMAHPGRYRLSAVKPTHE